MCGIFLYINRQNIDTLSAVVYNAFMASKARGPDNSHIIIDNNIFIGFHRLMINDLSYAGDQPMIHNENVLICNGEIYNFRELIAEYNLNCKSHSDCEVIVHLYEHFKRLSMTIYDAVKKLCQSLDGEFAFMIYDKTLGKLIVARDRFGMRPLFVGSDNDSIGFGSELKNIDGLYKNVEQFPPSQFHIYEVGPEKLHTKNTGTYYSVINAVAKAVAESSMSPDIYYAKIRETLEAAVEKRLVSDVPICALLSGGLDSSLVCGIITKKLGRGVLNTFSIGMDGSTDLYHARKVADYIGSIHHEVLVTEEEMLAVIEPVIKTIESYDITSVRASVPHYLISKYIKENTKFKCVLSGEMSDELLGGYIYFKNAPDTVAFIKETHRLLSDICYFDNLRADRCISSQCLEARIPFSDTAFIDLIQFLPEEIRINGRMEKYALRKAFDGCGLIPDEILWRSKEALSDGVSKTDKSWYKIIQDYVETMVDQEEYTDYNEYEKYKEYKRYTHCSPYTKEAYYYRKIFHKYYKNDRVIPYFWLPKWTTSNDPSARTLSDIYNVATLKSGQS
jgi:asparagine synthase (glutamine-hydrolysing)